MAVELLRHQSAVVNSIFKYPNIDYIFFSGGYGSGKSATVVFILELLIHWYQGEFLTFGVGGAAIKHLKETVIKDFLAALTAAKIQYKHNGQDGTIIVGTLTFVYFSLDRPDTIFGHNLSACLADEGGELADNERFSAAMIAVQERNRVDLPITPNVKRWLKQNDWPVPQITDGETGLLKPGRSPFTISTTTAQGYDGVWAFMQTLEQAKQPYVRIRAKTKDNWHNSQKQLERLYALYTPEEARVYLEGEYLSLQTGRVYAEFDEHRNVYMPFDIRPTETIYVGQDFNCLAGDTVITTLEKGNIRLDEVREGIHVLGPSGYTEVMGVVNQGICHDVYNINGIKASAEHPFVQNGKLVEAKNLTEGVIPWTNVTLLSWKTMMIMKLLSLEEDVSAEIKSMKEGIGGSIIGVVAIALEALCCILYIRTFGNTLTEKRYRRATRSTIKMESRSDWKTILLKTLSLLNEGDIKAYTWQKKQRVQETTESPKGIKQWLVYMAIGYVRHAVSNSLYGLLSRFIAAHQNVKGSNVTGIKIEDTIVYDLVLKDRDHLYYANGFPVHNTGHNYATVGVVRAGHVYVADEFRWAVVGDAPRQLRLRYPTNPIVFIPDASGKEILTGWQNEFDKWDVRCFWNNTNPQISERILAINKGFRLGLIHVFPNCHQLIRALLLRGFDDTGKPEKGKGPKAPDHAADSCEYMIWHVIHQVMGFDDLLTVLRHKASESLKREVA